MYRILLISLFSIATLISTAADDDTASLKRYRSSRVLMGTQFTLVFYTTDLPRAERAAGAAFQRITEINQACTNYGSESELIRLCKMAPMQQAQPVSDDLWNVLAASQRYSELSDGAFDVTVGPYTKLWRRARRQKTMPSEDRMREARAAVGYQKMILNADRQAVRLPEPGMLLDLGGIAKGYAADEALKVMKGLGVTRVSIDAGGDIVLGEAPPDHPDGWLVGIAPLEPGGPPSRVFRLAEAAVATSGDAWQYVVIDGRRYSHLVNPKTGLGMTDHSSVSVIAPTGMESDALASAVSMLGPEAGLQLIDRLPETAALIVRAPQGQVEVFPSQRLEQYPAVQTEPGQNGP